MDAFAVIIVYYDGLIDRNNLGRRINIVQGTSMNRNSECEMRVRGAYGLRTEVSSNSVLYARSTA
jgi:predicted PhzF superfamily epimerase YddE/YHI9